MDRLDLDAQSHVLVLTGAGISVESGIPTYRGAARYEDPDLTDEERDLLLTPEGMLAEPERFWRHLSRLRAIARSAKPNAAHLALASLEERLGERFLLVTQNVDGLHARAGTRRLVELHGNVMRSRCTRCDLAPFADDRSYDGIPPCPACASAGRDRGPAPRPMLRPDVVLFGEMLPDGALPRIDSFLARAGRALTFIAVGTSGQVFPAAELVVRAARVGGESWLFNTEEAANTDLFDHFVRGSSGATLPAALAGR